MTLLLLFNQMLGASNVGLVCDTTVTTCNTSTGIQAITLDLHGATPVGCVIMAIGDTLDIDDTGAPANDVVLSYGFGDAAGNMFVMGGAVEHGANPVNANSEPGTTKVVRLLDPAAGTIDGEADLTGVGAGFSADTVSIDWTNAPAAAYKLIVWAIAGQDMRVDVGTTTTNAAISGTVVVTHDASATEPLSGLVVGSFVAGGTLDAGSSVTDMIMGLGYASYDGTTRRQTSSGHAFYANSTGEVSIRTSARYVAHPTEFIGAPVSGARQPAADMTAVGNGTFTLTTRLIAASQELGYFAITGNRCYTFIEQWTTGTGTEEYNQVAGGVDFTPRGLLCTPLVINYGERGTNLHNIRAAAFAFGAVGSDLLDSALGEGTVAASHARLTVPSDDSQAMDDHMALSLNSAGNVAHKGSWDSYVADGFVMDRTDAVAAARAFPVFQVGLHRLAASSFAAAAVLYGPDDLAAQLEPDALAAAAVLYGPDDLAAQLEPSSFAASVVLYGPDDLAAQLEPSTITAAVALYGPIITVQLEPTTLAASVVLYGPDDLVALLEPTALAAAVALYGPALTAQLLPDTLAVLVAVQKATIVDLTAKGAALSLWPKRQVVQSGAEAILAVGSGMTKFQVLQSLAEAIQAVQSAMTKFNTTQSGSEAAQASQSGAVKTNTTQSGAEASTTSQTS